ncbi:MAG: Fe-S cluster assembly protein SufB, partial [Gammaproteobacteria bacterium]|nr:Fe-S cluster assembly protein SufB [Gammaproteobacteria bacterium]
MTNKSQIDEALKKPYAPGFVTDIEMDTVAPGLNEDVIRFISAKKNEPEFLLQWRLKAYHYWLTLKMPEWPHLKIDPIDYQAIS